MDFVIRQSWQDQRLNVPPGIKKKIILDYDWRKDIWTPDMWFKNALDTKLHEWVMPNIFFWIEPEHKVCFSGR